MPHGGLAGFDVTAHTQGPLAVLEWEPATRGAAAPDYYGLLKKTLARLQAVPTLRGYCEAVTEEVRALTGLDRVMVYRFAPDGSGWVFAESKRADLNLIDYDALELETPHIVFDLPAGGRRMFQGARGYVATIVSGEVIMEHGKYTGAVPGKLIRGAQAAPRAA